MTPGFTPGDRVVVTSAPTYLISGQPNANTAVTIGDVGVVIPSDWDDGDVDVRLLNGRESVLSPSCLTLVERGKDIRVFLGDLDITEHVTIKEG